MYYSYQTGKNETYAKCVIPNEATHICTERFMNYFNLYLNLIKNNKALLFTKALANMKKSLNTLTGENRHAHEKILIHTV